MGKNRHVREGAEIAVKSTSTVEAKGKSRYLQVKSASSPPTQSKTEGRPACGRPSEMSLFLGIWTLRTPIGWM